MLREFKVANCWEGRRIRLKMYLIEQKFAIYYHKSNKKKCKQMREMESASYGCCCTLLEKIRERKVFQKVKSRGN